MSMRNKILIALGMLAVILAGLWIWLRQPDEAKLSVEAVMGKRPKITAPRDQTFPDRPDRRCGGLGGGCGTRRRRRG